MGLAWNLLGLRWIGTPGGTVTGNRARGVPRVITVRTRRRVRRWLGSTLVTLGVIGLVHPDVPGVVPVLIGVAVLQMGSGRARHLLRRVDEWWQGDRGFFLGLFPVLAALSDRVVVGECGVLTGCGL